ncbi:cytochrome c/FTR1 family iron permease [Nitrosomonas europaea]|uniref:cytochrome c/FTR1 family iron permease n=1 Tax=Nitrosomonas TaxID=914 RepID=UPI002B37524F|nr:cytochrome c/FTR1 family iron permease [Nitrosomonas sp.]MEB2332299.1 cytochrome c/FTR1 family iron permease [Nitrosomonas sp.]
MNRSKPFFLSNLLVQWLAMLIFMVSLHGTAAAAPADDERAQTIVHMLDYVGVDYPEFVQDGKVLNAEEYEEQREFATQAITLLEQLPKVPEQPALQQQAHALLARIEAKAPGSEVSALASQLRAGVIQAWKLSVAPRQAPDLTLGAKLFAQHCATCHGAQGHGDGPLAKGMEPAPSNFRDEARMRQRSLYGLYNTITLGVGGTPMRAFTEFSEADRWALAFFAGSLRADPETVARGEAAWREGQGKPAFDSLKSLVDQAPGDQAEVGTVLDAVRTYLTQQPQALQAVAPAPLAFSRAKLDEVVQAYTRGDREGARRLAIAAYLEGFELVESALDNVDALLRAEVEREMMALRAAIGDGQSAEAVSAQVVKVKALLNRADDVLSGSSLSPMTAFVSSLLILLREGLEAILVLSAIIAFVIKTGRRDALPYIHAGWIGAVVLGVITWAVASYVINISGANRELTEGITALLAAAMLLYVGWWLHSRANAQAWSRFIREQVNVALGKRTLWAMAGISFLAVYRELFEVILFYEALWVQAGVEGHTSVLWGIMAATALLVLIGGAILRYSVRLPIGPFFAVMSALLAFMAVVFVGNGVAALQEAGVLDATAVRFISLPLLGIHPTGQGLTLQALTLLLIAGGFWFNRRKTA